MGRLDRPRTSTVWAFSTVSKAYFDWHHIIAHNLIFALIISGACAAVSLHRIKAYFRLMSRSFICIFLWIFWVQDHMGDLLFLAVQPLGGKQPVCLAVLFLAESLLRGDFFRLGAGHRDLRRPNPAGSAYA